MTESALVSVDAPITIEQEILSKLNSYEDYLSYYIHLTEAVNTVSWVKADLLLHMSHKLGEKSIEKLADELRLPRSTVSNYIRTARAFPIEKRNPVVSFSNHFQASFADEYREKTKDFSGEKRFTWINRSVDEGLSTRQLSEKIQTEKKETSGEKLTCTHCGGKKGIIKNWVFYSPGARRRAVYSDLHEECYLLVVDFMYANNRRHKPKLVEPNQDVIGSQAG